MLWGRSVKTLTLDNDVNAHVFVVKNPIYGDLTTKTRALSSDGAFAAQRANCSNAKMIEIASSNKASTSSLPDCSFNSCHKNSGCLLGIGLGIAGENVAKPLVLGRKYFTLLHRCPFGYRPVNGWEHQMPNIDIATPASSAPTDRLALGVDWVRPGAGGIGGTLKPSSYGAGCVSYCFEGNEK